MMGENGYYQEIREEIDRIPLVDTHEHLIGEDDRQSLPLDFFYLLPHYASSDLISSGMPPHVLEELRGIGSQTLPLEEKWSRFEPYWERIKNTGYAKVLQIVAHDIFGVEDINGSSYRELSDRIAASNKKGWYEEVLRDKANIECCFVEYLGREFIYGPAPRIERGLAYIDSRLERTAPHKGSDVLKPVENLDGLLGIRNLDGIRRAESICDIAIHSLDDFLEAIDLVFEMGLKKGIVGIKTALAYGRILLYERTTRHAAETIFNRIFDHLGEGISWREAKPLQDFLMHEVIRRAIRTNLPIQIHTGLQEGIGNIITNSNPAHLINLFIQYPRAKFDIFHASYPYTGELTALAKNFPNVYADLCWMHVISPYRARTILTEWIEVLPSNKVFGFGGDYLIPEGACAHAKIARENVTRVLAEKVAEGYWSTTEALQFARRILRKNPLEVFQIEPKAAGTYRV